MTRKPSRGLPPGTDTTRDHATEERILAAAKTVIIRRGTSGARMREIADSGASSVGVSCPFCMIMFGNAKDEIGVATQPFDVLELARRSMA